MNKLEIFLSNLHSQESANLIYQTVHQVIADCASLYPTRTAVVFQQESITYQELNSSANQLAHRLVKMGVKSDDVIVLSASYSPRVVIAILAIMKAGGAFAPIDINYPDQRVQFMLKDSQCRIVITDSHFKNRFLPDAAEKSPDIFYLDEDWKTLNTESTQNVDCAANGNDIVHAIYTSGTTGNPKASTTRHCSFMNLMRWFLAEFEHDIFLRKLVFTSFSFDLTHRNILAPLMCGGTTYLMNNAIYDVAEILQTIERHQITSFNCTPSAFYPLLEYAEGKHIGALRSLRYVFLGGEGISTQRLRPMVDHQLSLKIANLYGPSECADVSAFYIVTSDDILQERDIPIGRPNPGCELYVLDEMKIPVVFGMPGELYIGGLCVGRGYLNRPEMNKEKFIVDLFGEGSSSLFYKTGDRVKWLENGQLMFLGRMDFQVKYRGYRIELSEIETTLRKYLGMKDVVVMVRNDVSVEPQLVAYVLSLYNIDNHAAFIEELKKYLEISLPKFMIPGVFVVMDALPLTPNGKVDRNALPKPDLTSQLKNQEMQPPETPLQQSLLNLFIELLGTHQLGIDTDFFSVGGNSIMATKFISRVAVEFGVEVSMRLFFKTPTIRSVAHYIESIGKPQRLDFTIAKMGALPLSRSEKIPVSFSQQRLWIVDKLIASNSVYNVFSVHALSGIIDIALFEAALSALMQRHEILRTTFHADKEVIYQKIHDWKIAPFQLMQEISWEEQAKLEMMTSFDLSIGPLFRVVLIQEQKNETQFYLLFTIHHIISDGWTLALFYRELSELYAAALEGREARLLKQSFQYADYSVWQRRWLSGDRLEKQIVYWEKHLEDAPDLLPFPIDHPRPDGENAHRNYAGGYYPFELGPELISRMKNFLDLQNVTAYMTLFAAFQFLLHRYSGQDHIVIGVPIANRRLMETENMLGFFVNVLPIHISFEECEHFLDLISRVKEALVAGYENQDVPFEYLVDRLKKTRNLNYNPLFQVVLVMHDAGSLDFNLPGIVTQVIPHARMQSKFDLVLSVEPLEKGWSIGFEFSKELFDQKTIAYLSENFVSTLSCLLEMPTLPLRQQDILSPAQKKSLLNSMVRRERNLSLPEKIDHTLHALFEISVSCYPTKTAYFDKDKAWTYQEVNEYANRIAHYLKNKKNVQVGTLVGVSLSRSIECVVTLLALLKLGAIYVPLDPQYPESWLKELSMTAGLSHVITNTAMSSIFDTVSEIVSLDEQRTMLELNACSSENVIPGIHDSKAIIAVLYTSGSTGKPKGVMITHECILPRFYWMWSAFPFMKEEVSASILPMNTNDVLWEFFGSVLRGVPTLIVSDDVLKDLSAFILQLSKQVVTRIDMVPSYLGLLLSGVENLGQKLPYLCYWGVNGESLNPDVFRSFSEKLGDRILIARYGATEATTTYFSVYRADQKNIFSCEQSGPTPYAKFYILNENQHLMPRGAIGHIYVSSPTVSIGYFNNTALTQAVFINSPYATSEKSSWYKTGDMGRLLADGRIEFVGRSDHVVKIRGYRVQLGEIEKMVSRVDKRVDSAVVLTRHNHFGDLALHAFVVLNKQSTKSEREILLHIRSQFKNLLPSYMQISHFYVLNDFPKTRNGKIDRKVLLEMDILPVILTSDKAEGMTWLQEKLHCSWKQFLSVDSIRLDDHFFELGGQSLLAIRLAMHLQEDLKMQVYAKDFFTHGTIRELATLIETRSASKEIDPAPLPVLKRRERVYES